MTELQSESIAKIMPALLNAKANFSPAIRNATNPHFQSKFVDLEGVLNAVESALADERIILSQPTDYVDGVTVVRTRLIHESGEWLGSVYPVASGVGNPQAAGSALTYARRYTALAICGIAPEDDDGNAAAAAQQHTQRRQEPQPGPDPRRELFGSIAAAGNVRGMSKDAIAADFLKRFDVSISGAGAELLEAYLKELSDAA